MDRVWWLSSKKMTVGVATTEDLLITQAAPIVRKFTGQYLGDLLRWMEKQGGLEYREITRTPPTHTNNDKEIQK